MVPRQRIFGSDELSALSPAIAELIEPGYIEVTTDDSHTLGVVDGDGISLNRGESTGGISGAAIASLEVRINDSIAPGCAGFTVGHAGTENIISGELVVLSKAENWQRRRPQIIGSDGGGHV